MTEEAENGPIEQIGIALSELTGLTEEAEKWKSMYGDDWSGCNDFVSDVRLVLDGLLCEFGKLTGQDGSNGD